MEKNTFTCANCGLTFEQYTEDFKKIQQNYREYFLKCCCPICKKPLFKEQENV